MTDDKKPSFTVNQYAKYIWIGVAVVVVIALYLHFTP
jgi:heme exporter protein D